MTARRMTLTIFASLCATAFALAMWTARASALEEHLFLGSFLSVPSYSGQEARVGAEKVAVDDSSDTIYIDDSGFITGSLFKFNANGEPSNFSALETSSLYVGGTNRWRQVAVDNSSGPNKGDIYFAPGRKPVQVYSPAGEQLGSLEGPGSSEDCGVAVGPDGTVYVASQQEESVTHIEKFASSSAPVTSADYSSSFTVGGLQCFLAVDFEGSVYTQEGTFTEPGAVHKYDALQFGSPTPQGTLIDAQSTAVAVDPSNNHVLVAKGVGIGAEIVEYDSTGNKLEAFGAEQLPESTIKGLTVDPSNDTLYASVVHAPKKVSESLLLTFTANKVLVPDVTVWPDSNVTEGGVTLNANVNPLGVDATCKVEYGPDSSYGTSVPCSPADVGAGTALVSVSAEVTGLQAGALYHYRFALTNENGTEHTPDQTFAAGSKPEVDGESVISIGLSSAALRAKVNPRYWTTGYHFEYGTSTAYGSSAPVPDSTIGSGNADRDAEWTLGGLQPGTTYHFRVAATDAFGSTYGEDEVFTTYSVPSVGGGSCANAALRQAQNSTYLPDCRAYEMVSPPDKGSANIATDPTKTQATADGNAIKYWSTIAFGEVYGTEVPGAEYVARRGADGWSTIPINPPQVSQPNPFSSGQYVYLAPDLSKGVYYGVSPVVPGHPNSEAVPNLYLRTDLLSGTLGSYELLSDSVTYEVSTPLHQEGLEIIRFGGASADMKHVVFESPYRLTPEAANVNPVEPHAYEWDDGVERLVGILPNGEAASESVVGNGIGGTLTNYPDFPPKFQRNPISADGSRVIFEAGPLTDPYTSARLNSGHVQGSLYMRIDGTSTIPLNVSERAEPDVPYPAEFAGATPDDSKVFFWSRQALTNDALVDETFKLYRYDTNAPEGKHLTLISLGSSPGLRRVPNYDSAITGMSTDGSYVYFASTIKLKGQSSSEERFWLYVWHEGHLRLVTALSARSTLWGQSGGVEGAHDFAFRVTPDGRHALFVDDSQSAAERAGVTPGTDALYVYNYNDDRLSCVSCMPGTEGKAFEGSQYGTYFDSIANVGALLRQISHLSRPISDDGRYVFFESNMPLSAMAVNGRWNVYEYDTGSEQLHMISSGSCDCDSYFVEATPDGSNVFFTTGERLVRADIDTNADLYDARVGGGLASQSRPPSVVCAGESCQTPAEGAPNLLTPSSATFSGIGNVNSGSSSVTQRAVKAKLTRAQKLAQALRACRKKRGRQRSVCEAKARRKYGARKSARGASRRVGR